MPDIEEIENLKDIHAKTTREYITKRNQVAKGRKEGLSKKEAKIVELQEQLKKTNLLNQRFEKSSKNVHEIIFQHRY